MLDKVAWHIGVQRDKDHHETQRRCQPGELLQPAEFPRRAEALAREAGGQHARGHAALVGRQPERPPQGHGSHRQDNAAGQVERRRQRNQRADAAAHHGDRNLIQSLPFLPKSVDYVAEALGCLGQADYQDDQRCLAPVAGEVSDGGHQRQRRRRPQDAQSKVVAEEVFVARVGGLHGAEMQLRHDEHRAGNRQAQRKLPQHGRRAQLGNRH